jgi:DNA-nicking Smr family endonuclease
MKRPQQLPEARARHLSKEDRALWESTAEKLEPLKRGGPRVHSPPQSASGGQPLGPVTKHGNRTREKSASNSTGHKAADRAIAVPKPPELNAFDRRAVRKLRLGQVEIEARIDLHGLRQSEAHATLRRFLNACYARGQRWVLVITGKGAPSRRAEEESYAGGGGERGVLKRNVPVWLAEPELRAIVVSYTAATAPHGGEGALYVQLRNPERMKRRT